MLRRTLISLCASLLLGAVGNATDKGWYTEGNFAPTKRMTITLVNTLDVERKDCPIVITREQFPVKKLHELWLTVVDPSLPSKEEPTKEESAFVGGHGIRKVVFPHPEGPRITVILFFGISMLIFLRIWCFPEATFRLTMLILLAFSILQSTSCIKN